MTTTPLIPATRTIPEATVHDWCVRVSRALVPEDGGRRWTRTATGEVSEERGLPGQVRRLRGWIYRDVHLSGETDTEDHGTDRGAVDLLTELATGTWPSGDWRVLGGEGAEVEAVRRGVRLRLPSDRVRGGAGGTATLMLPRARPGALFGWFAYTGPQGPADRPDARLYLHLPSLSDRAVMSRVFTFLEELDVPWQAKAAIRGPERPRPDSFVVYLDSAMTERAVAGLLAHRVPDVLDATVPGFSVCVARGTALVVHPPGLRAGSFGAGVADLFSRFLSEHGTDGLADRMLDALNTAPEEVAAP